jgi:hypothetical protein
MRIAIDYDGTYTADPAFWDKVIELAYQHGHDVTCVTMRNQILERIPNEFDLPCSTVYTNRKAKAVAFKADIWIDDKPHWLVNDSA